MIVGAGALVVNIMGVGNCVGDCDGAGLQEARINTRNNDCLRIMAKGLSLVNLLYINEVILSVSCREFQQEVNLSSKSF